MSESSTRSVTADARGRVLLGQKAAGRTFLVEERESGSYEVVPAVTIPAQSAWLYQDPQIQASIDRGLTQAAKGLGKVMTFAASLEDEE